MTRILIADDHPLFRGALCEIVERIVPDVELCEADGAATLLPAAAFDFVIVDPCGEGNDGLARLDALHRRLPSTKMIVVSGRGDAATMRAMRAHGATTYIAKTAARTEIEHVLRGVLEPDVRAVPEHVLTPRQSAVLSELARGSSNRQIANNLHIEEITVKSHVSAIFRKLHVKSRLEAVIATRVHA
jgi:DNA-binding NarL/FixJ family response regulator